MYDSDLMESKLEIIEYETSNFSKPNLIFAVPEAGLVGTIAASYLTQQLKLPELGYVESELIPEVIIVHEARAKPPIRIFGRPDLALIVSEVPLSTNLSYQLANETAKWAKTKNVKTVIGLTSVPFEGRVDQEENEKPTVLVLASDNKMLDNLKDTGATRFEEGFIVGTYATLLKQCVVLGQPNLTLMADAYRQFPDPGAAAAVVEVLNKILSINVDVGELLKQSEEIRLRMRQLMARTQQNMKKVAETAPSYYT